MVVDYGINAKRVLCWRKARSSIANCITSTVLTNCYVLFQWITSSYATKSNGIRHKHLAYYHFNISNTWNWQTITWKEFKKRQQIWYQCCGSIVIPLDCKWQASPHWKKEDLEGTWSRYTNYWQKRADWSQTVLQLSRHTVWPQRTREETGEGQIQIRFKEILL